MITAKQHGMLFKDEMVNKVMDKVAPKTQTRRPITFSNSMSIPRVKRKEWNDLRWDEAKLMSVSFPVSEDGGFGERSLPCWRVPFRAMVIMVYPRIRPGDVIWVREQWGYHGSSVTGNDAESYVHYHADNTDMSIPFDSPSEMFKVGPHQNLKYPNGYEDEDIYEQARIRDDLLRAWWKRVKSIPGIHMPRWASRIDLLVLAMRSERVQEISEDDVRAEGRPYNHRNSPKVWFMDLWDSINTDRGFPWDGNHPVWIHDFKEVKGE